MKKIFISFDYDNDKDIRGSLKEQLESRSFGFHVQDFSLTTPIDEKWKRNVRLIIKQCDFVIFLCGRNTGDAKGVSAEWTIAKEENVKYFLLKGRKKYGVQRPHDASKSEIIHKWSIKNLKKLLNGEF